MAKKKQPDALAKVAAEKREISERVKKLANGVPNNPRRCMRFAVDGCRNYELEADGSFRMTSGGRALATSQWTDDEWALYHADESAGLWSRLEEFCNK